MTRSAKASARVTALGRESAAAADASRRASRGKAVGTSAVANAAKRQFQKTPAGAIHGHVQATGQRRQAKRDAR